MNYHALQTGINRRFDNGLMFSVFYVWSKTLGQQHDWNTRTRTPPTRRTGGPTTPTWTTTDRTTSWSTSCTRRPRSRAAPSGSSRTSGRSRASTAGRAAAVRHRLVDPRHRANNITGGTDYPARVVLTCDPGAARAAIPTIRSTPRASPRRRSAATATTRPVLPARPADQQPRPVCLQVLHDGQGDPARGAPRRLQRAQPHAVHGRQQHRQLREPVQPDHHEPRLHANGTSSEQRVREHQRVAPPRNLQLVAR